MYRSIFLHQTVGRRRGQRRLAAAGPAAARILGGGGNISVPAFLG